MFSFPPRDAVLRFRQRLEETYATNLGRACDQPRHVDLEGLAVWLGEYLRYRVHGAAHERAQAAVFTQIEGHAAPDVDEPGTTAIAFPPRDQSLRFISWLDDLYRDHLHRDAWLTAVDLEGEAVWAQQFLLYMVKGDPEDRANGRVLADIDRAVGRRPVPGVARSGIVRTGGRVFVDDVGPYLGVGATLFPAAWVFQHDPDRLAQALAFLASHGVHYIRALAVVGPSGSWSDRTIDPRESWWADAVAGVTDLVYDTYGLRIQWTIFGETVAAPAATDREAVVNRLIDALEGRFHKVQFFEVANEGYDNGFEGDGGKDEMRRLGRLLRDRTPNLIALSAPAPTDTQADIRRLYDGSAATLATYHIDRDTRGTGGLWRPVRQAREGLTLFSLPWVNNEPIGPHSSGAADDDPLRLAMAAVLTWQCGGVGYVFHSGAGIRLGGEWDQRRGLPAEFSDRDGEILDAIARTRAILPIDVPNWTFSNANRTFASTYPLANAAELQDRTDAGQLLRAFAAARDGRFVITPLVVTAPVPFTARAPVRVTVVDPLGGFTLETRDLAAGESYVIAPAPAAILLGEPV